MKPVHLHPGRERRVLQGHRWVFSNEISDPLGEFEPASLVEVFSARGVSLGCGYINPASLIAVRLFGPPGREPGPDFFREALSKSVRYREWIYPNSRCCRIVFGESDNLPGLVVDRYGDVLVYQIGTLGMARLEPLVCELLLEILKPAALVYRNDSPSRSLEGLRQEKGIAFGELPGRIPVEIDGLRYDVDVLGGQKTGMFLDQRDNRSALRKWTPGGKVLDLFCYNGAWSLSAAAGGAAEVIGVDVSVPAIESALGNAGLNGFGERCSFVASDVFDYLKKAERGAFDVIILDPPAFAKTKSAVAEAKKGYTDINRRALLALKPGGLLISCSCSYHMSEELFLSALGAASQSSGRRLRLIQVRGQSLDHPALLAMPETKYLKCCVLQSF
ncbi:MAG: class I SAM-dependent rRNA methyltransferase [Desulfobacteraceae bacterium]|nr:class I SAM-dependent rRNA methyltransferase [Desulfobacteraceae bacterium]